MGLVNQVVPKAELEAFTRNYALTMAQNAPLTLRSAKATVEQLVRPDGERDLAMLDKLIADCFNSQDYQEGVKAFSESAGRSSRAVDRGQLGPAMTPQSLKIDNARYVVTVDRERRIIQDGSILVEDGKVSRVGKAAAWQNARADRVIDARHLLVTPGFVNGHMHISYAHAVRGIFPDNLASPLSHVFKLADGDDRGRGARHHSAGARGAPEERDGLLRRSRQHEVPGRVPAGVRATPASA
mgnify:CR=1 FL=1